MGILWHYLQLKCHAQASAYLTKTLKIHFLSLATDSSLPLSYLKVRDDISTLAGTQDNPPNTATLRTDEEYLLHHLLCRNKLLDHETGL
jgi:hypothetical protein